MPNWCTNELTISGPPKDLKRFLDACMGLPAQYPPLILPNGQKLSEKPKETEPYFCFNALIPTPKEILEIGYDGHDKIPRLTLAEILQGKMPEPMDGYHWNIANWGTKWDIYHNRLTIEDFGWHRGCKKVTAWFDTAWSPPRAWLEKAIGLYPSLTFILHYEEPGNYFAGDLYGENGVITEDIYDADRCAEVFRWTEED